MKRYETYKETRIQWINNIPKHWVKEKLNIYLILVEDEFISQQELNPNGRYPVIFFSNKE